MNSNLTRGTKPRTAGITESRLSAITGLNSRQMTMVTTGGVTNQTQATCVLYDHTMRAATTDWVSVAPSTVATLTGTWLQGRLPFPATPCITLVFVAALLHRIRLRIKGKNQFGIDIVDELPQFTLNSSVVTAGFVRIWVPAVFAIVEAIEYQFPDTMATPPHMSCGLFFTWNPSLTTSVFNTSLISMYAFPLNQGIGTQMEVGGIVGAAPNLFPEIKSMVISVGTPGPTTIANVPAVTAIAGQGGFSLSGNEPGTDTVSGIPYSQITQDPNKWRLSALAGAVIKALDQTTNIGDSSGTLYTPPAGANPEIPATIFYHVRIERTIRPAARLAGPAYAP